MNYFYYIFGKTITWLLIVLVIGWIFGKLRQVVAPMHRRLMATNRLYFLGIEIHQMPLYCLLVLLVPVQNIKDNKALLCEMLRSKKTHTRIVAKIGLFFIKLLRPNHANP